LEPISCNDLEKDSKDLPLRFDSFPSQSVSFFSASFPNISSPAFLTAECLIGETKGDRGEIMFFDPTEERIGEILAFHPAFGGDADPKRFIKRQCIHGVYFSSQRIDRVLAPWA
jgi:hypothetical protein